MLKAAKEVSVVFLIFTAYTHCFK